MQLLTAEEKKYFLILLEKQFPGSENLRLQLSGAEVDPSIIIQVDRARIPKADVKQRIPVEAKGLDADGSTINFLLHVVDGYMTELEIFRSDGHQVQSLPGPESLEIIVAEEAK